MNTSSHQIAVRTPHPADCDAVAAILGAYAGQEVLLWRTAEDIRAHRGDFLVTEVDGAVAGCVALRDYGEGLQELRSLAVHPDYTGLGLGRRLVEAAVQLAVARGAALLFALTRKQAFFEHVGFQTVPMRVFPEKVWGDCAMCPRRERCDEVAVCLDLEDAR